MCKWLYKILAAYHLHCKEQENDKIDVSTPSTNPSLATLSGYKYYHLILLSRFSHVCLCVTPQTAAHQAPPSLGFSRQEHWSGGPFPSPVHESEK